MEKVKKHIQNAFTILSSVSVKGDDVDIVAAVRQELRHAFSELNEIEKQEVKQDG